MVTPGQTTPGNTLVLPDSRLREKKATVMVDWELPGGGTVRCEAEPIYCANCGKLYGYVPRENTTFAFWLCRKCFEVHGAVAGTYAVPDDQFNAAVAYELRQKATELGIGRDLTTEEVFQLEQQGKLGTALEKLIQESPYKVYRS